MAKRIWHVVRIAVVTAAVIVAVTTCVGVGAAFLAVWLVWVLFVLGLVVVAAIVWELLGLL